jgi:PadR family transcriptional regulator, regulatory protein PadR
MAEIRVSRQILKVVKMMMETPLTPFSGAEIARAANIGPGTLYPLLQRLENGGWLTSEWEKIDPSEAGRPKRRQYRLTGKGQNEAAKALSEVQVHLGALAWKA